MDRNEITERLKGVFADTLNVSEDEIEDESSPDTVESWDSFHHLQLIIAIEEAFAVSLTADEVTEMLTFGDAKVLLIEHGV